MRERTKKLYDLLKSKEYKKYRTQERLELEEKSAGMSESEKRAFYFCSILENEKPVIYENDRIGFYRYHTYLPEGQERGLGENKAFNYERILKDGFLKIADDLNKGRENASPDSLEFIDNAVKCIKAVLNYCECYRECADGDLKKALETVPAKPPKSYHEALVMLKILIYTLRCNNNGHITVGRFDQYMYPYYKLDKEKGVSDEEIAALTEEFFLSLNFDTDIYNGVQQGDNGQSLMLGGIDKDGKDCFNELSRICLNASKELCVIDPKINIRVNKNTPLSIYRLGTELTKEGLGFPQYSNDDIVIPGLIKAGYTEDEAYNYSVAACWEYAVPDTADVVNVKVVNFPKVVNDAVYSKLLECDTFEVFLKYVKEMMDAECDSLIDSLKDSRCNADPYFSLFISTCIDKKTDYSKGAANHYNFGFLSSGISNAADSLAAIKKTVFEDKSISAETLIKALEADFEGFEAVRNILLGCPKMGNDDDYVDLLANELMDELCVYLKDKRNVFGGIIRPGTGSAQSYIGAAAKVGATADGRKAFTPYSSSFSPAITTKLNGPLSVIKSFTKFDMTRIINGGPLTMEIHDNTFRNEYGIEKVAQMVKVFIELGGQQLQLNAVNRDKLIEAQNNPERYPNLIVRVWGWSGYFNELDKCYQDHIIKRCEFMV